MKTNLSGKLRHGRVHNYRCMLHKIPKEDRAMALFFVEEQLEMMEAKKDSTFPFPDASEFRWAQ